VGIVLFNLSDIRERLGWKWRVAGWLDYHFNQLHGA